MQTVHIFRRRTVNDDANTKLPVIPRHLVHAIKQLCSKYCTPMVQLQHAKESVDRADIVVVIKANNEITGFANITHGFKTDSYFTKLHQYNRKKILSRIQEFQNKGIFKTSSKAQAFDENIRQKLISKRILAQLNNNFKRCLKNQCIFVDLLCTKQKQGYGRKLIQLIEKYAKYRLKLTKQAIGIVEVHAIPSSQGFYKKMGYKYRWKYMSTGSTKKRKIHVRPGDITAGKVMFKVIHSL